MTDRELDALVAEKVMGWTYYPLVGRWAVPNSRPESNTVANPDFPRYSTDIAAAWPVFDQLGPAWQLSQSDPGGYDDSRRWWCWLPEEYGGVKPVAECETMAPTAPMAICLAALKAVGVDAPAAQPAQKQG